MSITADRAEAATTLTRRQLQMTADWLAASATAAAAATLRADGPEAAVRTLGLYAEPYSRLLDQGARRPRPLRMVVPRWWKAAGRTAY